MRRACTDRHAYAERPASAGQEAPDMAAIDDVEAKLTEVADRLPAVDAKVKLDLSPEGILLVDATQSPATISRGDGEADCTITADADMMAQIVDGSVNPMFAFMSGKLKVDGSLGVAQKLTELFT
jgi:putative sterol carrier protein